MTNAPTDFDHNQPKGGPTVGIEDTSKRPAEAHLIGLMGDGYIEGMEAAGQRQIVSSDLLPIDNRSRAGMEALGFVFGEKSDDLFEHVTLPAGWARKGSGHSMWSYLVDERGVKRVSIFHKAAFYDRSAHCGLDNVGYSVANSLIYGDPSQPDYEEPPAWDVLTEDEQAAAIERLRGYLADADRHPDIYGDKAPKVRELLAAHGG